MGDKKVIVVRVEVDVEDYTDAKSLCGMTHREIVDMIAEQGLTGLSNYVAATENWVDD